MGDLVVIGAGPAGVTAACRAAELGARTILVTQGAFGGMAAHDGPVPVRALAHAARLFREARQLGEYGIGAGELRLDCPRLLARAREIVHDISDHTILRGHVDELGVETHEHAGSVRFLDPHTIETGAGQHFRAHQFILCTGGTSRRLDVPGAQLTSTHGAAWTLTQAPPSMIVVGAGATGVQVASVFSAFGTQVQLFQAGPRILATEDEAVSHAVAAAFRERGMLVRENLGAVEAFEKRPDGVRMHYSCDGVRQTADAAVAVVAVGWTADTAGLALAACGVETDRRGFVRVDARQRTTAQHIYAAGDVTGRLMLVPQAINAGYVAASNAVGGAGLTADHRVNPVGGFTDPEFAHVGLTEAEARREHAVQVVTLPFGVAPRAIIDGRTSGFCKLVVERDTHRILGCHVVGEQAAEIVQLAAVTMGAGMSADELSRIPLSFPTYAEILSRAAFVAVHPADGHRTDLRFIFDASTQWPSQTTPGQ